MSKARPGSKDDRTFMELLVAGDVNPLLLPDFLERHRNEGGGSMLYEYLGMTPQERDEHCRGVKLETLATRRRANESKRHLSGLLANLQRVGNILLVISSL